MALQCYCSVQPRETPIAWVEHPLLSVDSTLKLRSKTYLSPSFFVLFHFQFYYYFINLMRYCA